MKKTNRKNTVKTSNGGSMTFIANERGMGGTILIERGYKETPDERAERLAAGNRARRFDSVKNKARGGRQGAKRSAMREW